MRSIQYSALTLVAICSGVAAAQSIVASGKLLDTKNKGIPNVIVQLKGTDVRDTTDALGAWALISQTPTRIADGSTGQRVTRALLDASSLRLQLARPGMVDAWIVGLDGARLWSVTKSLPSGETRLSHPPITVLGVLYVRSGDQEIRQDWNPVSGSNGFSSASALRSAARGSATGTIQFLTLSGELISESPAPAPGGTLNKSFATFPVYGRFHNGDSAYVIDSSKGTIKYVAPKVMVDWVPVAVKGRMHSGSTTVAVDLAYDPKTLSYSGTFLNPAPATKSWTSQVLVLDKSGHVTGIDSLEWNASFVSAVAMEGINYWNAMPVITKSAWFNGYMGVSNPAMTIRDDYRMYPFCSDTRSSHFRGGLSAAQYIPYLKYEMSFAGGPWTPFEKLPADSGTPSFKLFHIRMPDTAGSYVFATRCTDDDSNVVSAIDTLRPIKDPPNISLDFDHSRVYTVKDAIPLSGSCSDANGGIIHSEWRLDGGVWNAIPQGISSFADIRVLAPKIGGTANIEVRCTDDDSNQVSAIASVPVLQDAPVARLYGVSGWSPLLDSTAAPITKRNILGGCHDSLGRITRSWIVYNGDTGTIHSGYSPDGTYDRYDPERKLSAGFYILRANRTVLGHPWGRAYAGDSTIELTATEYSESFNAQIDNPVELIQVQGGSVWAPDEVRAMEVGCEDDDGNITRAHMVMNASKGYDPNVNPYPWSTVLTPK
ncbi:MAG: hypothetical protein RL318_229 [Fibrobacterota bacterium]|jgi:hypothetical protein